MAPSGAQQAFFRQGATPAQPKRKPQDRPGRKAAQRSHPHARRSRSRRLPGTLAATLWDLHQSAALCIPCMRAGLPPSAKGAAPVTPPLGSSHHGTCSLAAPTSWGTGTPMTGRGHVPHNQPACSARFTGSTSSTGDLQPFEHRTAGSSPTYWTAHSVPDMIGSAVAVTSPSQPSVGHGIVISSMSGP